MKKEFNITGACFPHKHYMVDISGKIAEIIELVERGKYFVINRPRQYGKTTTLNMLTSFLNTQDEYLPINISFEGIGSEGFQNANVFSKVFYRQLRNVLIFGMLRNKYLQRYNPGQFTFYSVILAGVHDIKTLKLQIRPQSETKYNSPWNIAVDFTLFLKS